MAKKEKRTSRASQVKGRRSDGTLKKGYTLNSRGRLVKVKKHKK